MTNISSLYRNTGRLKKSLEYIERARLLNKEKELEEELYLNKATVELELGEFKNSIKSTKESLNLNPNLYLAHDNLCLSMQKIGDFENAEVYYKLGLSIDPEHIGINEYLGELYVQTGRIDEAKKRLKVLENCKCKEFEELKSVISTGNSKY